MALEAMDIWTKAPQIHSTAPIVRNTVLIISHVTFRDCRVHIFSDNLSRNSCIRKSSPLRQGQPSWFHMYREGGRHSSKMAVRNEKRWISLILRKNGGLFAVNAEWYHARRLDCQASSKRAVYDTHANFENLWMRNSLGWYGLRRRHERLAN